METAAKPAIGSVGGGRKEYVAATLRRRFRFSIRTMLILVTLIAVYFGSWQVCAEQALQDVYDYATRSSNPSVSHFADNQSAVVPFLVGIDEARIPIVGDLAGLVPPQRCYYVWLGERIVKLPYERSVPEPSMAWGMEVWTRGT